MYCIFPHSNFDDWKWSTDKKCIHNETTSYKIHTLDHLNKVEERTRYLKMKSKLSANKIVILCLPNFDLIHKFDNYKLINTGYSRLFDDPKVDETRLKRLSVSWAAQKMT